MTDPYYEIDGVTLYHGDCRTIPEWLTADVLVTDPPYPNSSGHFDAAVGAARDVLAQWRRDAVVFWSELERPPVPAPLVAVHIWHRTNVNGKPYEPAYRFAVDGKKRRSLIVSHVALDGPRTGYADAASPAYWTGHPTEKPLAVMTRLLEDAPGVIADPFAGSGSTLVAARNLGRRAVGVELEERYCEMTARRLSQGILLETSHG